MVDKHPEWRTIPTLVRIDSHPAFVASHPTQYQLGVLNCRNFSLSPAGPYTLFAPTLPRYPRLGRPGVLRRLSLRSEGEKMPGQTGKNATEAVGIQEAKGTTIHCAPMIP